jgi:circadian clock protein KaiB
MSQLSIKLYVAGESVRTDSAVRNLKQLLDESVGSCYELKIIDVTTYPALAEKDSILATPTLIKTHPAPQRRIIGDLSNKEALLLGLDLAVAGCDQQRSSNEI